MLNEMSTKRRSIFLLVLVCCVGALGFGCNRAPAPTSVDKAKFAKAWAAYTAIEAATTVGVNYPQFGTLLQEFATEVMLVPSSGLTEREAEIANTLTTMIQAYKDSASLWSMKFDGSTHNDEFLWIVDRNGRPTFDGALEVENRYRLYVRSIGLVEKAVPADSVAVIWQFASKQGAALAPELAP